MTIKISGTFKKDQREYNGLEAIAKTLAEYPLDRVYVVGVIETKKITKNVDDGGTEDVTIRFVQIEALGDDAGRTVKELLQTAFKERVGRDEGPQEPLPIGEDGAATERPKDEWLDGGKPVKAARRGR